MKPATMTPMYAMIYAWVVYGQTGEYSDHREWLVAAYVGRDAEREATRHADRAKERVHARETTECAHGELLSRWCEECWDAQPDPRSPEAFKAWMGDLDPEMGSYIQTADYCALRVTLRTRAPRSHTENTGGGGR